MKQFNPPPGLVVVKVGGSLYDHRHLGPGLRQFLDRLEAPKVLLVAGGGEFANYVRELDAWHDLGDAIADELAYQSLQLATAFLEQLVFKRATQIVSHVDWWRGYWTSSRFLWSGGFIYGYEELIAPVPHTWELTTDSIAAYAAAVANAKLILLKSVDIPPGTPWVDAAKQGWVDAHFPTVVAKHNVTVEAINFRRWLDERTPVG